jgi:hypothetical protein
MLVHFMAIWSILRPFGIFSCNKVYFPPFWYAVPTKKNMATLLETRHPASESLTIFNLPFTWKNPFFNGLEPILRLKNLQLQRQRLQ